MNLLNSYKLDHVGIAVSNISESAKFYHALGFDEVNIEEVASEGVRVGMFELANQSRIELIEPLSEESSVARFLRKKGSGIHHICLQVEDLVPLLARLRDAGIRLIYDEPRKGAHQCLISFVHPASAGGVLIELSQKMDGNSK